jgi:16S rRNA (cytosine1402-N4)-methyltransferase
VDIVAGPDRPSHVPVMRERVLALLDPAVATSTRDSAESGGTGPVVVVDATVGLGGHAAALLAAHPHLRLIGLDRDPQALARCADRLAAYRSRVRLVHTVYDALPEVLAEDPVGAVGAGEVAGVLFDLGVSSLQLDADERGFSYSRDTALDMRMNPNAGLTAADVVNGYSVPELTRVLRDYGEERYARRIALAIERERAVSPFSTSGRLAELVRQSIPAATRRVGGHPAKRTFQALRIEVNDELGALERALPAAVDAVRVGGRVVVISYHSLEDRLVKRVFAAGASTSAPPDLPVVPESAQPRLRLLTRGAEQPSPAEIIDNPRAASARLRAVERVRAAA